MIKALIDLGTNTFNLIIANVINGNIENLYSTKEGVALGMGGINQKRISDDALNRAIDSKSFVMNLRLHKFQQLEHRLFVTQLIRRLF